MLLRPIRSPTAVLGSFEPSDLDVGTKDSFQGLEK